MCATHQTEVAVNLSANQPIKQAGMQLPFSVELEACFRRDSVRDHALLVRPFGVLVDRRHHLCRIVQVMQQRPMGYEAELA